MQYKDCEELTQGARLKIMREHLKITQSTVAGLLGVSIRQVVNIESSEKIKPFYIERISSSYGVNKHWLLTGKGEMFADKDNIHQNQSGSNNIQVGGNMGNIDRPTPTQQTQIPKNQYCIEDEEVAALCFSAYTSAKALGRVDKLKLYLASAVPEILK